MNWTENSRHHGTSASYTFTAGADRNLVANFTTIPCTYSLSPSTASFAAEGGSSSVTVTALPSTCPWTASTTYNWIHTTSSGTGSGTAGYSVDANTSTSTRSGTLTIAGQTFTVSQAAASGGPDTTPPTVSMTSPIGGSTVSNTSTLTASATDNVSVTRVDFYSDVAFVGRATVSSGGLFTVPCDTTQMANGSHTFCAKAYDAAGNWTISGDTTVTVSNLVLAYRNGCGIWWQVLQFLRRPFMLTASTTLWWLGLSKFRRTSGRAPSRVPAGMMPLLPSPHRRIAPPIGPGASAASGINWPTLWRLTARINIIVAGWLGNTADFGGVVLTAYNPYGSRYI